MRLAKHIAFCILSLITVTHHAFSATTISIVVEPHEGGENPSNSREAHFNWSVESENGSEAQIGQYACGSYWVAPASGDTGVKLISLTGNSENTGANADLLRMDDDPLPWAHGLTDGSNNYGSYDATQNEIPNLPTTYSPSAGSAVSLVACMQRPEGLAIPASEGGGTVSASGTAATNGESVDAYCVVTVLESAPADDGDNHIRPNIVGDTKYLLTMSDLDLDNLPALSTTGSRTAQDYIDDANRWSHSIELFSQWQWDPDDDAYEDKYSEGGRGFRAQLLHDEYGSHWLPDMAETLQNLLSDDTNAEKQPLIAAMVSYGLDMYHQHYSTSPSGLPEGRNPGLWASGAGQSAGSAINAYFAVALLDATNPTYAGWAESLQRVVYENWDADNLHRGPDEMRHNMRGTTGVLLWGNNHERRRHALGSTTVIDSAKDYWGAFVARHGWDGSAESFSSGGVKTEADPHGYIDGPPGLASAGYLNTTAGPTRDFAALCVLMPRFGEVVNTTDPIEYADRLTRHGIWASPDPLAVPTLADETGDCNPLNNVGECGDYRTLWGPTASDWRFAVEDGSGRWESRHGDLTDDNDPTDPEVAYRAAGHTWAQIMALYDGPTYDERSVDLTTAPAPDIYTYPDGGSQYAIIRCGLDDATIYYTTDGSEPTSSDTEATPLDPIAITEGATIKAIAVKSGFTDSGVTTKVDGGDYYVGAAPSGGGQSAPPVRYNAIGGAPVWAY